MPIDIEINDYIIFIRAQILAALDEKKVIDPLVFWPLHKDRFPILYRIATQVLARDTTSGTPERTNSLAGIPDAAD